MIMGPDRPSTCTKRLFKCHIHIFGSTSLEYPFGRSIPCAYDNRERLCYAFESNEWNKNRMILLLKEDIIIK